MHNCLRFSEIAVLPVGVFAFSSLLVFYTGTPGRAITRTFHLNCTKRKSVVKKFKILPSDAICLPYTVLSVYEKVWEAYQFYDCSLLLSCVSKHVSSRLSDSIVSTGLHYSMLCTTKIIILMSVLCLLLLDEPSSSSNDHDTAHIPASAVISSTPIITTIPPSPTSPTPIIRRQLSHDQGEDHLCQRIQHLSNFKNVVFNYDFARISNLDSLRLTILESDSKTERSRSFDEGLDNYREEERGYVYIQDRKSYANCIVTTRLNSQPSYLADSLII